VYEHIGSPTELHKLIIFICFKLLKKIMVSLFDEILFQNNDVVHDASFFYHYMFNYFCRCMCDTRLTSYTISFLIKLMLNFAVLRILMCLVTFFSKIFIHVCRSNLPRTDILWDGNGLVVVVTWPVGFSS